MRYVLQSLVLLVGLMAGGVAHAACTPTTNGTIQTQSYMLSSEFQDGQAAGSITPACMRDMIASTAPSAVCTNNPGSCSFATNTVVQVACGATLTTFINGSSPSGTIYQLAGTAASPCTYASVPALTVASNITIQGDCASPVGANTILDGANASTTLLNGFSGSKTNVTIKCLTIQHFFTHTANCNNSAAMIIWDGWDVENNTIKNNGCYGLWSQGAATVRHNYIANNQIGGMQSQPDNSALTGAASNGLIVGNEFDSNGNTGGTDTQGVLAGVKVVSDGGCSGTKVPASKGVRILYNYVHNTLGTTATNGDGIWTDCETSDTVVSGNTVVSNAASGIHVEISVGIDVSHNVMMDNNSNDTAGAPNVAGCIYVNTSSNVNIHDNFCKVNTAYGAGIGLEAACRADAPAASAIGNIKNVWVKNNTIVVPTTNTGSSPFQGTASYTQDDSTASGSTSYGALCSGNTHPAGANWNVFANNTYYLATTSTTAFSANSCGIFPNFTLAQIQAATGNACLTAPNYPNDLGSSVTAYPAAMASMAGCMASAVAGKFCDQQPPPW